MTRLQVRQVPPLPIRSREIVNGSRLQVRPVLAVPGRTSGRGTRWLGPAWSPAASIAPSFLDLLDDRSGGDLVTELLSSMGVQNNRLTGGLGRQHAFSEDRRRLDLAPDVVPLLHK